MPRTARVRSGGVAPHVRSITEHQTGKPTRVSAKPTLPGGFLGGRPTNIHLSSPRALLRCPVSVTLRSLVALARLPRTHHVEDRAGRDHHTDRPREPHPLVEQKEPEGDHRNSKQGLEEREPQRERLLAPPQQQARRPLRD